MASSESYTSTKLPKKRRDVSPSTKRSKKSRDTCSPTRNMWTSTSPEYPYLLSAEPITPLGERKSTANTDTLPDIHPPNPRVKHLTTQVLDLRKLSPIPGIRSPSPPSPSVIKPKPMYNRSLSVIVNKLRDEQDGWLNKQKTIDACKSLTRPSSPNSEPTDGQTSNSQDISSDETDIVVSDEDIHTTRTPHNSPDNLKPADYQNTSEESHKSNMSKTRKSATADVGTQTEGRHTPPGTHVRDLFSPPGKHLSSTQHSSQKTAEKPFDDGIRGSYGPIAGKNYVYRPVKTLPDHDAEMDNIGVFYGKFLIIYFIFIFMLQRFNFLESS